MGMLARIIADMKAQKPDHIACLGDLVNIGLRAEFPPAAAFMKNIGDAEHVSLVPGNHDAYVRPALADITRYLSPWMTSDSGRFEGFPYVRLRGPIALIGLSSGVPTMPLLASGTLGPKQREDFEKVMNFLSAQGLARVVLIHHPPHQFGAKAGRGLTDAVAFENIIARTGAELILHGHNHAISVTHITGKNGKVPIVGAPSASAISGTKTHRAGYHLFSFDMTDAGVKISARTRGMSPDGEIADLGPLTI
jgi:3',5'-cyclic AMP phosphodiesterase CpdA